MIDKYTAQAKTQEEAIEKGLKELQISRSEAEIQVNSPGKKGFLGFGAKDAVVTVKRKGKSQIDDVLGDALPKSSPLVSDEKTEVKETKVEDKETPTQPTEPVKTDETSQSEEQVENQSSELETKDELSEDTTEDFDENDATENPEDLEAIDYVRDYLANIINHMGIDDATVTTNQDDRFIQYDIETEDAGLVIGRHGKVLNGLQTLAQIQLHQRADNKLHARVDAENYRNRRKDTVEHLAKKTAKQVMDTNQSVILEPMPAHERKQIHRYLSRYNDVQTHSEGKEPHRYLVVEPKNK